MNIYDLDGGGTCLAGEGPWELCKANRIAEHRIGLHSYIVHVCNRLVGKRYWWAHSGIDRLCEGCDRPPPDKIMTLWKLHNFDYIQNGWDE